MELSQFNKLELQRLSDYAYNIPFLIESLEKEREFYRSTGQFKKLEDAQMFLIKLYGNK